jgi:tungstate transport system substrate-binding protein
VSVAWKRSRLVRARAGWLRPGANPRRRLRGPLAWTIAACAAAASCVACDSARPSTLDIATTTSVQNSGLLDVLLPAYRARTGVEVRVHAAGSGRALQMLSEDLVQLVISHAPEAEARALGEHPEWVRHDLAQNQFIVVGPADDPADVRGATDAVDAFRRLAGAPAPFVSRGDQSGTHERELALWKAAGRHPPPDRLIVSGRGMSLALRHADEVRGYTLSDEATYRQMEGALSLTVLLAGDPGLANRYAVIHSSDAGEAKRFAEWLVSGDGRSLIGNFQIGGRRMFELPPAQ